MSANGQAPAAPTEQLVEHYFRHEAGSLTATLLRRFGAHRLEVVEDSVQHAFSQALGTWSRRGFPDNPGAWLSRTANNYVLDQLKHGKVVEAHRKARGSNDPEQVGIEQAGEDLLVLLFACADERLSPRARLILCLKLVSGFSTEEIAQRLFMPAPNVQKTLERAKARLKATWNDDPKKTLTSERLATVQLVLYLQFNEGYTLGDEPRVRRELCDEAIRLTEILAAHPAGNESTTFALLSLMLFNASRIPARLAEDGSFVPLEHQNRGLWDRELIQRGLDAIRRATEEDVFTRFHGEAAIQTEHVMSPSFGATNWNEIAELYGALEKMHPSPVYTLNRAIALAEAEDAAAGLALLEQTAFPPWFTSHHLYHGAMGDLLLRAGHPSRALPHFETAASTAPSAPERAHFESRAAEGRTTTTG